MITTLIFDFSNVLLFVRDGGYSGKLNDLHARLKSEQNYKVLEHFRLDTELLAFLESFSRKVKLHLFTEGSMHLIPEIYSDLQKVFTSLNSAKDIGFHKNDPQAYVALTKKLQLVPSETLFIDDKQENIDAAKHAGLEGVRYISIDELRATLRSYGILE